MNQDFLIPANWYNWQKVGSFEAQSDKTQQRIYLLIAENKQWKPAPEATIEQIGMMYLQWVQGQRLIDGYQNKLEPEAGEYVEMILNSIEKVHGQAWVKQVQKWYWQYLIDQSEKKAA